MHLLKLSSNKDSFKTITFKEKGLNIIVGTKQDQSKGNNNKTYNGVGKSLVFHLIHFCLGSGSIKKYPKELSDFVFTLDFKIEDEFFTCTRSLKKQDEVIFNNEKLKVKDLQERLFKLCFGDFDRPKYMTWVTLLSRFIRKYRQSYIQFDRFVPKELDYSMLLNNSFLLGLNTDLVIQKKELKEQEEAVSSIEKILKKDEIFKKYFLGSSDTQLDKDDLICKIQDLEQDLSNFKVAENYHHIELEADSVSRQKKKLENEAFILRNTIKNIEESESESYVIYNVDVATLFNEASVEIPSIIKHDIDEVTDFHSKMLNARNKRMQRELKIREDKLHQIESEIEILGSKMNDLLLYLKTHGAIDEYKSICDRLDKYKRDLKNIDDYNNLLKEYEDEKNKNSLSLATLQSKVTTYLRNYEGYTEQLRHLYKDYSTKFYPGKMCGLVVSNNNGRNSICFNIDAKIQDDSSDGINEVRIFCFDWLILMLKKSKIRFLAHDSRIFANMDPRQRETLFKLVYTESFKHDVQYICSINEDALDSIRPIMQESDYQKIIQDNIVLELKDTSPQSKLLGMQVEINLEV